MGADLFGKVWNTQSGKILPQIAGHRCRVIERFQTILQEEYASSLVYHYQGKEADQLADEMNTSRSRLIEMAVSEFAHRQKSKKEK